MRPEWYPDWTGETCVIVASGPSAQSVALESAKGKAKVIAINLSWELCPWADVLYACDWKWWSLNKGVPSFAGLKICADQRAEGEGWGCRSIKVLSGVDTLQVEPGSVGRGGGSSGFQSANLAVQWGVKKIILVGYDATIEHGYHWHGKHQDGLNNPSEFNVRSWKNAMNAAGQAFKKFGVTVINTSMQSTITAYPKMSLEEALAA